MSIWVVTIGTHDAGMRQILFKLLEGEVAMDVAACIADDAGEPVVEVNPVEDALGDDLYELVTL